MTDSIHINLAYFLVALGLLVLIYYILCATKESIYSKKIAIETRKKIYEIPYDICDIYLTNIRNNLKILYKNSDKNIIDKKKCSNLRHYIDKTHLELKLFIDNVDVEANDIDILRYDVINKYELIRENLQDDMNRSFTNILIDIEIILYMIRHSLCKDKKLILISLHNLMEQLYITKCFDKKGYDKFLNREENDDLLETFTGDREELYDITGMDIMYSEVAKNGISGPSTNSVCTQNISANVIDQEDYLYEKETMMYETQDYKLDKLNKYRTEVDSLSQNFECSADYILISKSSQPYSPPCDINALREERENIRNRTVDLKSNKSLSNDYDFLDT